MQIDLMVFELSYHILYEYIIDDNYTEDDYGAS